MVAEITVLTLPNSSYPLQYSTCGRYSPYLEVFFRKNRRSWWDALSRAKWDKALGRSQYRVSIVQNREISCSASCMCINACHWSRSTDWNSLELMESKAIDLGTAAVALAITASLLHPSPVSTIGQIQHARNEPMALTLRYMNVHWLI